MPLDDLRRKIDDLDDAILAILEQRTHVVDDIAAEKRRMGAASFHDPERERKLLDRVAAKGAGRFPREAIRAVFRSWMGKRAVDYRRLNKISNSLGTAVNVCTMVFGNMGDDSGTGVAFTRNPALRATSWAPGTDTGCSRRRRKQARSTTECRAPRRLATPTSQGRACGTARTWRAVWISPACSVCQPWSGR